MKVVRFVVSTMIILCLWAVMLPGWAIAEADVKDPNTGVAKKAEGGVTETAINSDDLKTRLKKRVEEYWGFKIKRDFEKTYPFETPEYREKAKPAQYATSFGTGAQWLTAVVKKAEVEGNTAKVWVEVTYKWTFAPKEAKSTALEKWQLVADQWYHVRNEKINPMKPVDSGSDMNPVDSGSERR